MAAPTRMDAVKKPWRRDTLIVDASSNRVQAMKGWDIPDTIPELYPIIAPPSRFIRPSVD